MIKALAFLALLSSVFASHDWIRTWYVLKPYSNDYTTCDVPGYLSVANITLNPDNTLNLLGMRFFQSEPYNWTLGWEQNNSLGHFCQEDGWCVNGTLSMEKGELYASLDWYNSNNLAESCGVIMIPANMEWTGKWMVIESHLDRNCPVPQNGSVAEILAFGEQLLMIGIDNTTGMISSWTLNFTAKDQDVSACIEPISMCTNALIDIEDFVLSGSITWFAYNIEKCSVLLGKLPNKFPIGSQAKDVIEDFAPTLFFKAQANRNAEGRDAKIPRDTSDMNLTEERLEDLSSFLA